MPMSDAGTPVSLDPALGGELGVDSLVGAATTTAALGDRAGVGWAAGTAALGLPHDARAPTNALAITRRPPTPTLPCMEWT